MSIVNLKILSFKTYQKIESIPFSPFTCIVGPNGVGKSNLIDALLFVLGASPSEIRGTLLARDSNPPTTVELSFRCKNRAIVVIRRDLINEASVFYIDGVKVASSDYYAYLETQNISTLHRNFLISQNESLIKSPKDLSKFIDKISGSSLLKDRYKELKQQKDALIKEYHKIVERKKLAETSAKEYEQVMDMQAKHRSLIARRRVLASSKIKKRQIYIKDTKKDLFARLACIEQKDKGVDSVGLLHKEMASVQTLLIKAKAAKAGIKHQQDMEAEKTVEETRYLKGLHAKEMQIREKISEAQMQIDDSAWAISKMQSLAQSHPAWSEHYQKDILIRTLSQIQRIEDSKSILQLKIAINELRQEVKEIEQQEKEQQAMEPEYTGSERLAHLNQSLLETLKSLSSKISWGKEAKQSSRLGYLISRIKSTIPQVIGRVCDLITAVDQKYYTAVCALIHNKRNTIIIEQEKHVLPILNGLTQTRAGRVTILPLNRLGTQYEGGEKEASNENIANRRENSSEMPAGYVRCRDIIQVSKEIKDNKEKIIGYVCENALIYLGEGVPEYTKKKVITLDGVIISKSGMMRKIFAHNNNQGIKELEKKRDRILEEIARESQQATLHKEAKSVYKKTDRLKEVEKKLENAQKELEEAENNIEEQIKNIMEKSQIPIEIIKQAKEQGIVDTLSANRKIQQMKKKELSWKKRLEDLASQLQKIEEEVQHKQKSIEKGKTDIKRTEELDEEIVRLEGMLIEISQKLEPSLEIEAKVIKEQIVVLDDEMEEIEQYMAEEGLTETAVAEAPSNIAEEDLDKLEREIATVAKFLSHKGSVVETHQLYMQLEKEAEEKKGVLAEVAKEFQKVRKERTSLFLGIFDQINTQINKYYAKLTENTAGHVRAHLGLENSLEPYLAGTQIFVMPTGKTFREAKYLSGGEKTMVALSLLLSIDSIYPSLFYIFDELDAALDKDKISSLRESLQEINTQFIAVTHRIELFETADTLIGVAKPPKGHSQIFTLKL